MAHLTTLLIMHGEFKVMYFVMYTEENALQLSCLLLRNHTHKNQLPCAILKLRSLECFSLLKYPPQTY